MDTLKTLYNVGKHTDTSGSMPKFVVVEKEKDYEVRKYLRNKYAILRLKPAAAAENGKDKGVESVTKQVWRMMKYTQGENEQKIKMTLHLPVIVQADSSASEDEDKPEVTIMVTLPIEYQDYNEGGATKEAPKPDDTDIVIEYVEEFQGFVKSFSGFANDSDYKKQTKKLNDILEATGKPYKYKRGCVLCLSYDIPTKLVNRRNEVIFLRI